MWRRFLNLFRPDRLDEEIFEELEFHRGRTTGEFGRFTRIQEQTRDASTVVWLETLARDVRYGMRQLLKTPVLSLVAVLSLALGIGANVAIFSLINAVLLRSLPVAHPEELTLLAKMNREGKRGNVSFPFSQLVTKEAKSFSGVLVTSQASRSVLTMNGPERLVTTESVSANYFGVLGLTPALGRFFAEGEDRRGAPDYAVISYGGWRRHFGSEAGAIGKSIERNGTVATIVGVAPAEFFGISVGSSVDVWFTLSRTSPAFRNSPGMNFLQILGRRKPDVSEQAAQAEVDALYQNHIREYTSTGKWTDREKQLVLSTRMVAESGATGLNWLRLQYSERLQLLFAITGFVLLVACANIANLLLARAAARRREIGMRMAIGASRGRVVRQLITESLLLAGFGGTLALGFAFGGARLLVGLMSGGGNSMELNVAPDSRVLLFSAAVTTVVGLLFGIVPAMRSVGGAGLSQRAGIGDSRRPRLARVLIGFQVALTLVLVAGSGLFLRTLVNLQKVPLGFEADGLYKVDFRFRKDLSDEGKAALKAALPARLTAIPGVRSATLTFPWGGGWTNSVTIPSYSATEKPEVYRWITSPGFFDTMRIPVVAGRDFSAHDTPGSARVTIINQALARRYFAGRNPIGETIAFPGEDTASEIVAVVGDTRSQGVKEEMPAIAYTSLGQAKESSMFGAPAILLRLAGAPRDLARELKAIEPGIRVDPGVWVKEQIENQFARERVVALLSSFFAGLGTLLACIGLYGILSYALSQRTTEIGVRLALGARPFEVVSMVLRESAVMVVLGLVAGVGGVLWLAKFVQQFLFGLLPTDPSTIAGAVVALALAAAGAALLPARRASRLDPMEALRRE